MKEGKRPRVTTQPFSAPMAAAMARAATKARRWGHPARIIRAKAIEEAPSTDPTDRSNSPAIMSRVTPMATNPSSAAMVMIPARESRVRKYGAVTENPMKTARNPASAPTSGWRRHPDRRIARAQRGAYVGRRDEAWTVSGSIRNAPWVVGWEIPCSAGGGGSHPPPPSSPNQRIPCLISSSTRPTLSLSTNPGPVSTSLAGRSPYFL
jgi:hypothetical protein